MKPRYLLLTFLTLWGTATLGQTLEEARKLFSQGCYEEAKPTMKKYYKQQPSNANYNFWYGVCCLQTGEPELAVGPLELAVKRRVTGGRLYLGQTYEALYRYEDAVQTYEDYIADLTRLKKSTTVADSLLAHSKLGLKMLKGVEQVCVVDSVVMSKAAFLQAYRLSPEVGQIYDRQAYLKDGLDLQGTVYETEMGNRIYYADADIDGHIGLHASDRTQTGWSEGHVLPGLEQTAGRNANYPYVMTDGITLYYAAQGEASLGGLDIFVTRYHAGRGSYLAPENLGMPFNSPANDYLYVIDEYANLGWWATDRRQPTDSVCIYVFVPNRSKHVYNYDATDPAQLRQLARIHSISQTWADESTLADARTRLANVHQKSEQRADDSEFVFVINDDHVYTSTADFRSPQALEVFQQYRQLEADYQQQLTALAQQREAYTSAPSDQRQQWASSIAQTERQLLQLHAQMDAKAKEVRKEELGQ